MNKAIEEKSEFKFYDKKLDHDEAEELMVGWYKHQIVDCQYEDLIDYLVHGSMRIWTDQDMQAIINGIVDDMENTTMSVHTEFQDLYERVSGKKLSNKF